MHAVASEITMGHWGTGPFDNDMAEDWLDQLVEDTSYARLERTLVFVDDSDNCCWAIAAGEVVAALRGHPMRGMPDELKEWLADQDREVDDDLAGRAVSVVKRILGDSELKVLWEDDEDWRSNCEKLLERLAKPSRGRRTAKRKRSSFDPQKDTPKNMTQAAQLFKSLDVIPSYERRRVTDLFAMNNDEVTDEHLQYLSLMPQIEAIHFQECRRLTPEGLMQVAALPNLKRVVFERMKINEDFMRALAERPQITQLILTESGFVDDWLPHATMFSDLDMLELSGTAITNDGCKTIARIKSLTTLYLNETEITAEGVAKLKDMPKLEMLGLFRTSVDDSVVPILRGMTQLDAVLLRGSKITREAVKELQRSRRDLSVNM